MKNDTPEQIFATLETLRHVSLVYLFGSYSKGQAEYRSDIDIAVAGETPLTDKIKYQYIKALSLIFERPIDLIDLHTAPVPLLSSIFSTGKILKNEDSELHAKFIRRLWSWNEDMSANHNNFLRRRREIAFDR